MTGSVSPRQMVGDLQAAARTVLAEHVPPGSRVVLIDFPQHRNAGDSAIFLGELEWVRESGHELAHVCSLTTYDRATVRRELGDGTIVIHGGGNFGDVWPWWHALREEVARDFPDRRIIQLPQTLRYSSDDAADAARSTALGRHEALTIVTRDHQSLALARDIFSGATVSLAPDMAFFLGMQSYPEASRDGVWLARSDHERAGEAPTSVPHDFLVCDWTVPLVRSAAWWGMWALPKSANKLRSVPRLRRGVARASNHVFRPMAQIAVTSAFELLASGRVVVTDRLHAHIMSTLLGRPNVVLDNNYGKISTFISAWTSELATLRQATGADAAADVARSVLAHPQTGVA